MKRSWSIVLGGLIAAALAYACVLLAASTANRAAESSPHPEMAWLKKEYHLTDAQFARVVELHEAYWPKCAEMCHRIDAKNAELQGLLAVTNAVTPQITAALADAGRLRTECQSAMLQHFYEVSQVMPPEQGKRYLAWVQQETLLPGQMVPLQPSMKPNHR